MVVACAILAAVPPSARAQSGPAGKSPHPDEQKGGVAAPRVSLSPRFTPGEKFRYEIEVQTTTATSRSGIVSDPQGPSTLVVDWKAIVRIEVLPAGAGAPGGILLRTTYEKSTANVRSDTFDPAAAETQEQYQKLEGKIIEFALDARGKVSSVAGLEGMADGEKAAQAARDWIAQISASAGAPPGGVAAGQTWSSEQPANTLPIAGLVWRSDSQYLRNEPCRSPIPGLSSSAVGSGPNSQPAEDCAVILTELNLVRPKPVRDPTPPDLRKNGVQSAGKWSGSGQSLLYVSLASGLVVRATQTGKEEMDVTLTTNPGTSLRYSGTISSRSQVALVTDESKKE